LEAAGAKVYFYEDQEGGHKVSDPSRGTRQQSTESPWRQVCCASARAIHVFP
jgi:hypothetical protein